MGAKRPKSLVIINFWKVTPEAVPFINYIGRQLDVSYIVRQVYGEIIYLSDKNLAWNI